MSRMILAALTTGVFLFTPARGDERHYVETAKRYGK